jgi:hypothetical protein
VIDTLLVEVGYKDVDGGVLFKCKGIIVVAVVGGVMFVSTIGNADGKGILNSFGPTLR